MESIASRAYPNLGSLLTNLGYIERYGGATDRKQLEDPWHSLRKAQREDPPPQNSALGTALALFLRNKPLPVARVESAFGRQLVFDLSRSGMLAIENETCSSRFCVLVVAGYLLLVDWPVQTPHGFVSSHVYLGNSSCECVRYLGANPPKGNTLEIGCGTGILCLIASDSAASVTGSDIWGRASHLAHFNMALNRKRIDILFSDLFKRIPAKKYDTIFCNPPWRLAPPTLHYPNPRSRVGAGPDGLDFIRRLLKESVPFLAPNGSLWFPVEFPGDTKGFAFKAEVEAFIARTRCSVTIAQGRQVPVESPAVESAETCLPWNPRRPIAWLKERFLSYYRRRGFTTLYGAFCSVTNDNKKRLTYR